MECPKCGATLDDDARFCTYCGQKFDEADPISEATADPMPTPSSVEEKEAKPKLGVIELTVGALLICVGLAQVLGAGTSISSTSFGGDFYTYTYQGIVAISELLASIQVSLGWVIVAIGAAVGTLGLRKR